MGFTGARVGEALGRGFMNIGDALYQAAQNKQRRKQYEASVAEDRRRYDDSIAWRDQQAQAHERQYQSEVAEDRRRYIERIQLEYGPGAVVQRSGSLVGPGGRPVAGTERSAYAINPNVDPTQGYDYRKAEALGELETEQNLDYRTRLADEMAGRGLTPTGARLQGPQAPSMPTLRGAGGREFPDTDEGRAALLEWQRMYGEAGRKPEGEDPVMALVASLQGNEMPNDAGPQLSLPGGKATASAQTTKQTITQDQADYLREVRGMSDEEIAALYIIGG